MANTLTGLYQTIYAAMNRVSQEPIGMIGAVSKDAQAEMAAVNQPIRSPIVPDMDAEDITPGNIAASGGNRNVAYVDLTITKQRKVDFHITGEEQMGLEVGGIHRPIMEDSFMEAMRTLNNEIEADLCGLYKGASRAYGTSGTTPFATADNLTHLSNMKKILDDNGAPMDRHFVYSTEVEVNLLGVQGSVFRVNESGDAMERRMGRLGMLFGFMMAHSGGFVQHPAGVAIAQTINMGGGEPVGATSLTVDAGSAAEDLVAGDFITIAGDDNKYVIPTDQAGSITELEIAKPGLQEAAADNAAVTHAATAYMPNLAFSRNAFHLACRVPAVPDVEQAEDRMYVTDPRSGLTYEIALYGQYRQMTIEVGICWGVVTVKPEHAAILLG